MRRRILFLCTGNVCRSPMAAALFNERARGKGEGDAFQALSAGTWALENQPASGYAVTSMAQRGIDLAAHRARTVEAADLESADAVIVMTRSHREAIAAEFPQYRAKVHLMSELKGQSFDVGDPYGGSLADYRRCAKELEELIDTGYNRIKAWTSSEST